MPYREKTAWLYLAAMAVTFGPYFAVVATGTFAGAPMPNFRQLAFYGVVAVAQMLILGVGHLVLRSRSPEEACMPLDERGLAIERHSMSLAYYALMAGMILVGILMPFLESGWTIVNAAIFAIFVAQVLQNGAVVVAYRRQS